MSLRGLCALVAGLLAGLALLVPGEAWAATDAAGVIGSETIVIVPAGRSVHTLVDLTWTRLPPGQREFVALPQGFTSVQVLHPRVPVSMTQDGVWVDGRPVSLVLNVISRASTPYLLQETASAAIETVTLFVGGGAYPSGNALGPFTYAGRTRLAGRVLRVFAAKNVAQGTQLFIPIALSSSISVDRAVVAVALGALGGVDLLGAAWWTLRRFGGLRV